MVVEIHLEYVFRSVEIEILIEYAESSARYQLLAGVRQMSVKLERSPKGRKVGHEEAVLAVVEEAEVELLSWRRFLDRSVNST